MMSQKDATDNVNWEALESLHKMGVALRELAGTGHASISSFSVRMTESGAVINVKSSQTRFLPNPDFKNRGTK